MKILQKASILAMGAFLAAAPFTASADTFTFSKEFSGSGDSCANGDCATLEVTQNGANVDFVLTANLKTGEYIPSLFGNREPYAVSAYSNASFTGQSSVTSFNSAKDAYKADGDGDFDWQFDFDQAPPDERFENSDVFKWTFANTTLAHIIDAISQNGPDGKTGFTFALRVRGLGADNEGSGWFYSEGGGGGVPEPASIALLGLGLAGLALTRRRKQQ